MVVLLMTMHVKRPLDFSVFPAVLLVATLFRLALNVSATRLVLLHGYAGSVIQSFGNFVVGGNLIVGLVVFLILIVIQFVVVTTGAGRVAEVAARFTLDAMPGKQMAIDADLNSGLIDQQEAKRRRQEIVGRGRLLRGHGRCGQVRPGRRHRRHRHHRHQPDRRSRHRHRPAPSLGVRRHPHLQPPERGRRARLADPGPSDVHLDRDSSSPGPPPTTRTSAPTSSARCVASTGPSRSPVSS